jgi:hypothetical protein
MALTVLYVPHSLDSDPAFGDLNCVNVDGHIVNFLR